VSAALLLLAFLVGLSDPARAGALDDLCKGAGKNESCVGSSAKRACPADWERKRQGDCWTETAMFGGKQQAYVHPKGWVVDPRCFQDSRFSKTELMQALDLVSRKFSPAVGVESGGCLGKYNPAWGRKLGDLVWDNHMHLACPPLSYGPTAPSGARFCALHETISDGYHLLSLLDIARCHGCPSWLAGIIFHEALHAAGADNLPTEEHNRVAVDSVKMIFMRDRVYSTTALCFLGSSQDWRQHVNPMMCRLAAEYGNDSPAARDACAEFPSNFTNLLPPCMLSMQ